MCEDEHLESLANGQDTEAVPHRPSRNSNRRAAHSGEESGRLLVEYQAQLVAQVARLTEAVLEDTRIRRQQVEATNELIRVGTQASGLMCLIAFLAIRRMGAGSGLD